MANGSANDWSISKHASFIFHSKWLMIYRLYIQQKFFLLQFFLHHLQFISLLLSTSKIFSLSHFTFINLYDYSFSINFLVFFSLIWVIIFDLNKRIYDETICLLHPTAITICLTFMLASKNSSSSWFHCNGS